VKTSDARKHLHKKAAPANEEHRGSGAVVGMADGVVQLGVPAIEVKPMYSPTELSIYGVQQRTEVRIPVFSAAF